MEKLETIGYELDELYKVNQLGSCGLIINHKLLDLELQKIYAESKIATARYSYFPQES